MGVEGLERIDCSQVEERDLAARYAASRLEPDEAERFEVHYFECERCWARVERATEIRAAFVAGARERDTVAGGSDSGGAAPAEAPGLGPQDTSPGRRWLHWGAPAAAAALLVGLIVGRTGDEPAPVPTGEALRGPTAPVPVTSAIRSDSAVASWSPVTGAELYAVHVYAPDGSVILNREVVDPRITIPVEILPPGGAFWSIEALDELREVLGRSRLVPVDP